MKLSSKGLRAFSISLAGACSVTGIADFAHAATTYLGDPINYSFGIVQVQITVDDAGKITKIDTPQSSTRGSNGAYTSYAVPILVTEALKAQSANIQGVSGASYLSRGWTTSLASAIAQISRATVVTPSATPAPVRTSSATPTATPARTIAPAPAPTFVIGGEDDQHGENGERGENEGRRPKTPPPVMKSPAPVASTIPTPTPKPTPTPTPTLSQPPLVLKPGSSVIQKSITCVKGSVKKVVKGLNPKCPTGYTLKKP
jgi:uncharacterized protein with FMN-binding domain